MAVLAEVYLWSFSLVQIIFYLHQVTLIRKKIPQDPSTYPMIVPKNISHFPIFQVKCGSVESTTTSVCFQVGESWRRDQRKPRVIVFAILVEKKLSHNDDRERNIHLILKENTQIKSFILGTTMFHIHHIVQLCVHSTTCQAPIWQLKKKFDN